MTEVGEAEAALKRAEDLLNEMIRQGDYGGAVSLLFKEAFKPLFRLVADNAKSISDLRASLEAEREIRARDDARLSGAIGELRGRLAELAVRAFLRDWFRRHAPEYKVLYWDGMGADVLIEGRGVLAAVDLTITPKEEDIEQLKVGAGAVAEKWGKKPDLLAIYSQSGVIPPEVVELAEKRDVFVLRSPRKLKELLDELAGRVRSRGEGVGNHAKAR